VPARKSCQGSTGSSPLVLATSGRKKRSSGSSSRAGVPGGSSSYAASEKATTPVRSPERASLRIVCPKASS
jgi:hypothetical protein